MLLYKNLTTNKECFDFYGLGIFFSKCYCLTTLPFLENMSMHFILKTFTLHCKKWPIRSALVLLKDGNWVLIRVYNPMQIKGSHFLLLCKESPELYKGKLTCPQGTFQTCFEFKTITLPRQHQQSIINLEFIAQKYTEKPMVLRHSKRFSTHTQ